MTIQQFLFNRLFFFICKKLDNKFRYLSSQTIKLTAAPSFVYETFTVLIFTLFGCLLMQPNKVTFHIYMISTACNPNSILERKLN